MRIVLTSTIILIVVRDCTRISKPRMHSMTLVDLICAIDKVLIRFLENYEAVTTGQEKRRSIEIAVAFDTLSCIYLNHSLHPFDGFALLPRFEGLLNLENHLCHLFVLKVCNGLFFLPPPPTTFLPLPLDSLNCLAFLIRLPSTSLFFIATKPTSSASFFAPPPGRR